MYRLLLLVSILSGSVQAAPPNDFRSTDSGTERACWDVDPANILIVVRKTAGKIFLKARTSNPGTGQRDRNLVPKENTLNSNFTVLKVQEVKPGIFTLPGIAQTQFIYDSRTGFILDKTRRLGLGPMDKTNKQNVA